MINNENSNVMFSTRKFGLRDKIGYLFGDFGNDFLFMFASSYLMVFYTDVFGLNPITTGMIFLVARFWDAFMDVTAGRFIDSRATTKNGKFKPWIIRFAPILVILSILLFTKLPGLTSTGYLLYAITTYILWGTLYSFVNIPYGSMASVISADSVERSSLSTFRSVGSTLATVVVTTVVPIFAFVNNKAVSSRFFIIAVILGLFAIICYNSCYKLTTERIMINDLQERPNILASLKALRHNTPFIAQVCASLILIGGQLFSLSLNTYLYKDYFKSTTGLAVAGFITILNVILVAPMVSPLIKKFGKKETSSASLLFCSVGYFLLYLVPTTNVYLFVVLNFIVNIGYMLFAFMLWAFVTDVIDYQELITGSRQDGTVYSFYTFARKIGQAISGLFVGTVLSMAGYVKAPHQNALVAANIRDYATLFPAIAYFVAFLCLAFWYPLNKKKLLELQENLRAKHVLK